MKKAFVLFLLLARFELYQLATKIGPYKIHITAAEECPDTGTHKVILPMKILNRTKNTITFGGDIVLPYGWSNNMTLQIDISQWTNGKWNDKFFSKNFGGICNIAKSMAPTLAKDIFEVLGTKDCPKPGNYTLKEIPISTEINGVPMFVYGKYKGYMSLIMAPPERVKVGCYMVAIDVVPKPKGTKRKTKHS